MMVSSIKDTSTTEEAFLTWFKSKGGTVHPAVGLTTFPRMGRGAIATLDIKKGTILFTLPRSLTLSMRTSCLLSKFGPQEWKKHQLHKGWVGLILCMLWEAVAGDDGKWSVYLNSFPSSFETPMFWSDIELQELQGTTISDKIGKDEAEKDYYEKLIPAIESRPDLFPTALLESHYSLHKYHIMGSLILSRSFQVESWSGGRYEDSDFVHSPTPHSNDVMEVDDMASVADNDAQRDNGEAEDAGSEEEDDDFVDPMNVAMVPMADMLNARYRSENARLCYESENLQMIATRDIPARDQILNTYGDLPNSDLLRRYGYVDLVPIARGVEGNPADIVEIRADLVVNVLREQMTERADDSFSTRIDWWLEEGGDDIFILETDLMLPDDLVSLICLLSLRRADWEKARAKGRVPKPKSDTQVLRVLESVLQKRLNNYRTSVKEDEILLARGLTGHKHMAVVVRLGEKRILRDTLDAVRKKLAKDGNCERNKRKDMRDEDDPRHSKRSRA